MNDVHIITVKKSRKYGGLYIFDDLAKGLVKEPFVTDASAVIDRMKKDKGIKGSNVTIMFSKTFLPKNDEVLVLIKKLRERYAIKDSTTNKFIIKEYVNGKYVSGTYKTSKDETLWLCPAQLKYFDKIAPVIYVKLI